MKKTLKWNSTTTNHLWAMHRDPTKTIVLRNRAAREVARRFGAIKVAVNSAFTTGGLKTNINKAYQGQFAYLRDDAKVPEFERFLKRQIDDEILRLGGLSADDMQLEDHWLNRHIGDGYNRGAVKTRLAVERALPALMKLPDYSPFANPAHVTRSQLIFARTFSDLEGVTQTMSKQMSRILSDGILKGKAPKVVARELNERVDKIGITRAKLIARTEIIEAHNSASILEAELLEKETGVTILMEWMTAGDRRVRPTHADRDGLTYTRSEAQDLIGEPNCRCSVTAVIGKE